MTPDDLIDRLPYDGEAGVKELAALGDAAVAPLLARLGTLATLQDPLGPLLTATLGRIGNAAVEPLRAALATSPTPWLLYAVSALKQVARPLAPEVARCLQDDRLGDTAASVLSIIGVDAEVVPALIAGLRHPNPGIRRACIRTLGVAAAPTPELITALRALADDPEKIVRTLASQYANLLAKRASPPPPREPDGTPARRKRATQLDKRARRHNWDDGIASVRKIIADPDCDQGTALRVYWMGRPEWPHDDPATLRLFLDIEQHMAEGFYTLRNIPFDPRCDEDDEGYSWVGCYDDEPVRRTPPALMYRAT